jgi:predicted CoA-binding protein
MSRKSFFQLPYFAVVGASTDRSKFGNKVLRSYKENNFQAVPINPKQTVVEGIPAVGSLAELCALIQTGDAKTKRAESTSAVGVSIITPPAVTRQIMQEGVEHGYVNFFLQPGTYDGAVDSYIKELKASKDKKFNIIKGCVLVELGFDEHT